MCTWLFVDVVLVICYCCGDLLLWSSGDLLLLTGGDLQLSGDLLLYNSTNPTA